MNQSLATLIKLKLFQGSNSSTQGLEEVEINKKKDKKLKRRDKTKHGANYAGLAPSSFTTSSMAKSLSLDSQNVHGLHSIGEEIKRTTSHEDVSLASEGANDEHARNVYQDDTRRESFVIKQEENGMTLPPAQISPHRKDAVKRQGKLRMLKNKISIPELGFRSSSSPQRHQSRNLESVNNNQSSSPHGERRHSHTYSLTSSSSSPIKLSAEFARKENNGFSKKSFDKNQGGLTAISKIDSNSSTGSSSRYFFSPKKTSNMNNTNTPSAVRFSDSNGNLSSHSASASVIMKYGKQNTSSSSNSNSNSNSGTPFHHSRTGSMEMKTVKGRSLAIGRRRSRTVDVSDYAGTSSQPSLPVTTGNDFISSITTHLRRSRSNSVASKSPMLNSQDTSQTQFPNMGTAFGASSPTPPRLSNGSIPFPTVTPQATAHQPQVPLMSRRSSSIVNALNSFVNLRSSSASSVKGPTTNPMTPKFDLTLADFAPPPEPEADEACKDFLARLAPYGKFIGVILSESNDRFKQQCLIYFLSNYFDFKNDPLDISLRKLLMFLELPKETQQIDRLLSAFGKVYYEVQKVNEQNCPWTNENQVYFLTFSLLMLHTDYFNPNNKYKMSKTVFIDLVHEDKVSDGCKIPKEILSYYYDNVTAKESPKFDFFSAQQTLNFSESSDQETDGENATSATVYSPINVIKTSTSIAYQDQIPMSYAFAGRTSSNSFSSYFPHVPVSTSSSNASLFQEDIDIYSYILEDSLSDVDMSEQVDKVWDESCIFKSLVTTENKYNKYFSILKEIKGGYLRIHKSYLGKIALSNFEILNESENDYMYLKIIQMGEISELTINKKFSLVGSANKILWKKEYGILSSCGLLIFDNMDWIEPNLVRDEPTGTSNYIIDYKLGASMIRESPLCCNGLFAISKQNELARFNFEEGNEDREGANLNEIDSQLAGNIDCIIHLHGSPKTYVWKCATKYERDNWIDAINLMAAYDGCYYNPGSLENGIFSLRKHNIKDRINKLENAEVDKAEKLQELKGIMQFYRQTMPLTYKTRNELTLHIKQLAVRMDWLVYEIKRNQVYMNIIKQVDTHFEQYLNSQIKEGELESRDNVESINESFLFNEEMLQSCLTDD